MKVRVPEYTSENRIAGRRITDYNVRLTGSGKGQIASVGKLAWSGVEPR